MIYTALSDVIAEHSPDHVAVEEIFLAKNAASALKLGHARGAAICAAVNAGLPVYEYSAKAIKRSVVGYGAASKDQMQHMVLRILNVRKVLQADEGDGLGVAVCHAHTGLLLPGGAAKQASGDLK